LLSELALAAGSGTLPSGAPSRGFSCPTTRLQAAGKSASVIGAFFFFGRSGFGGAVNRPYQ